MCRCKLPCFQPHKDIVLPPMLPVPALFRDAQGIGSAVRHIDVYFRGAAVGSEKAGPYAEGYSSGSRQYSEKPACSDLARGDRSDCAKMVTVISSCRCQL